MSKHEWKMESVPRRFKVCVEIAGDKIFRKRDDHVIAGDYSVEQNGTLVFFDLWGIDYGTYEYRGEMYQDSRTEKRTVAMYAPGRWTKVTPEKEANEDGATRTEGHDEAGTGGQGEGA